MGNQNCQSEKTIRFSLSKQSLSQFEVIENRSDSVYGDIFVVKDPENSVNLAVRQKMLTSENAMQEYARKFLKFKRSLHKNLVEIKKVQHTSAGGQLCKGQGVVCVALEYYPRSLRAEHLRRRLCRDLAFSSEELLLILKSLVSALAFLQIHRRQHGRICLDFIFVNDEGEIKLLDPQYVEAESLMDYFLIRPEEVIQAGFFVSPSQMETLANISQRSLRAKEQKNEQVLAFKSDVFTLGCVLLQLANNQNLTDVFDYTNFFVCADSLAKHIQRVRQQHSEQLADILLIMTCFQDKSRPDFIDLAQHLGILTSRQQSVTVLSEINPQSNQLNQVTTEAAAVTVDSRNTFSHKNQQSYSPTFLSKEPYHPIVQLKTQTQDPPLPSFTGQGITKQNIPQIIKNSIAHDENNQFSSAAATSNKEHKQQYSSLNSSYSYVSLSPTPCKPISLSYTRSYAPEQTGDLGSQQICRVQECTTTSFLNFEKRNEERCYYNNNKADYNSEGQQQQPSIFVCDNYEDEIRSSSPYQIQATGRQIQQEENHLIQSVQNQHCADNKSVINGMSYAEEDCLMESLESPHTNAIQRMKSKRNPFNISGQLQDSNASTFLREYEGELCNYPYKKLPIQNQQVNVILDQDAGTYNKQTSDPYSPHAEDSCSLKFVNETYPDNSLYVGYSLKDLRHGQGQMLYNDGGRYVGQWKYGKMNGNGILYYNNNEIAYEGTFKDDKFHGQGKLMNFPSSSVEISNLQHVSKESQDLHSVPWLQYQGEFQDDKIEGEGLMLFTDNRKYYGHFSNGYPNGQGILFDKDDQVIKKGIWAQGKLISILS